MKTLRVIGGAAFVALASGYALWLVYQGAALGIMD